MPSSVPSNPSISNVRAIITTRWNNTGYRPKTLTAIESYFVDTALDNDSDSWQLSVADPHGSMLEMFQRDSEIRLELFGVGREGISYIMNGIADEASFDDGGSIQIMGRDFSSVAVDSTAPPYRYKLKAAHQVISTQAQTLNFPGIDLSPANKSKKTFYTDGSESYWDFWYRMVRKEKQFLWCDPKGTLISGALNYHSAPVYFFGTPASNDPQHIRQYYTPVERLEINKNMQRRYAAVWVFGQRGEQGFMETANDSTTKMWVKKSRKIMFDSSITSPKKATKTANEEIFEGKVGSLEIKVTIVDPGIMIRQNSIAKVNIPQLGLTGEYFVVGSKIQCDSDGFVQEVRLREKQFAVSQRIPVDPKLAKQSTVPGATVSTGLGKELEADVQMPESWGNYFIKAAKDWHGPWDYNLFLATLIGICDMETGGAFNNVRETFKTPGPSWYPPPPNPNAVYGPPDPRYGPQDPRKKKGPHDLSYQEWLDAFANSAGNPRNPFSTSGRGNNEAGVGPFQLTSVGLKESADDRFKPNHRNEYTGGRWHPEHNIYIGAEYLRSCLKQHVKDSGRDVDIWAGVAAYNGSAPGGHYSTSVKNKVLHDPGYLATVTSAVKTAREAAKASKDGQTDPSNTKSVVVTGPSDQQGMPTKSQTDGFWNSFAQFQKRGW